MQSVNEVGTQENSTDLVTAEALREMTITKEDLFDQQKKNVLDSLMSTMVRIASEQGGTNYVASLNPQFDAKLLASIVSELETLGYKIETESKTDTKLGSFISVTINW